MWRNRVWATVSACGAVLLIGALPPTLPGQESPSQSPGKRQRDTVHLVSRLKPHDPKLTDTLDGAVASLQEGHEVMILFDGKSVTWLRMHRNKGQRTPLEEADIAEGERQALAQRLGIPPSRAPRNYFEYVEHLARAGAKVFVNRNAVRLYGLLDEEIHPMARPIPARQMADIIDASDLCYTYGSQ